MPHHEDFSRLMCSGLLGLFRCLEQGLPSTLESQEGEFLVTPVTYLSQGKVKATL